MPNRCFSYCIDMKCIATVLQYAMTNTFKVCPEIAEMIKDTHQIIKQLHTPATLTSLKKLKFNPPPLDFSIK